ncbi:class I SAM-dependent methyltransferase [Nocardia crassostreae]|uniref:class I SAM-dependent methyltransferase n=1 Tax=Nocardia crassostreae TaxID=53428 RepID=UPI000829C13C|nr:class I SAM-dependent methyltransferase [Nocardia crassostreae]
MTTDIYSGGPLGHAIKGEDDRLRLLEQTHDPVTAELLDRLPIRPDWHCLDIGAGAGSIARLLADRCPDGQVTAADIDTRFLTGDRGDRLRVLRCDIRSHDFPKATFDFVRIRMLLMHLDDRERLLRRILNWLRPGGWILISELDILPGAYAPDRIWRLAVTECADIMENFGTDARWASRGLVPALSAADFTDLGLSWWTATVGDGGAAEDFWLANIARIADLIDERCRLTRHELDQMATRFADPTFAQPAHLLVSAWGRRPAGIH